MQSIGWYVRRLQAMTAGEIIWRIGSLTRDQIDRLRVPLNLLPKAAVALHQENEAGRAGFAVSNIPTSSWRQAEEGTPKAEWLRELIVQADKLATGRLSFFDLQDKYLGDPIDWHFDHAAGKSTSRAQIQSVDYRDFKRNGDCKLVWEPNRHHHLVVLARAYRATGERRYAEAVVSQLTGWMDQNPFGYGMNWRSPLELGVRLINWVWAIDLIRDAGVFTDGFYPRFRQFAFLHCWETARKYSQGSSANNHLVGEAAGVYVAASYFKSFEQSERWRKEAKAILCHEIQAQTYMDGCIREHGLGYQFFVLQFYIISGLVGRWTGDEYPREFWERIERMIDFVSALSAGGEDLPMFGDRDDGYVLDLGNRPEDVESLMSLAALLFHRGDLKLQGKRLSETACWLLGEGSLDDFGALETQQQEGGALQSCSFPESGYHLLQAGRVGEGAISLFFDCAELGYGAIAAHGHADALSIALRVDRRDVLVDPGTYDYFTYPEWRQYFRKSCAHNTLTVDGLDQSELQGAFLWGRRANSFLEGWQEGADECRITGSHDGYTRLDDPVTHRRSVCLWGAEGRIEITDEVICKSSHEIALGFQFSEHCQLQALGDATFRVKVEGVDRTLLFRFPATMESLVYEGSENPKSGWISRGYHQKVPAPQIVLRGRIEGAVTLVTTISYA